ncbi:thiamine diphosphate-binding protein [Apiospora aurea]|uniref:Thiamine diphosphate-binding protein n=1 Tax=Apiospora aurea TaxID=335848 RepID=A0ABR1Q1Q8_9PEZI
MGTSPLLVNACIGTLLAVIAIQAVAFLADTWKKRSLMKRLSNQGKPMPPFNTLMGHLLAAKSAAHSVYILNRLAAKHAPQGAYYVDFTPMAWPMLVVTDPVLATQVVEHPIVGAAKPDELYAWFHPITNGASLFTQNGAAWKRDRDYFLPFFSNQNLDASVPFVVGQMAIFRDKLREKAREGSNGSGMFVLEPLILSMMNDIIGKLVLNADLGTQHGSHPLATTMLRQLRLKFAVNNPLDNLGQLNPMKVFNLWNNSRMLDNHIKSQIDTRLQAWRLKKAQDEQNDFKSLLDVALETYMNQDSTSSSQTDVSAAFSKTLCSQMRMFFFAGYDSTASTMAYGCYTVWQHPDALRKLRAEHDQVFGPRPDAALDAISANPAILNALPYTTAVVKETMRLFPAANGIRQGHRDLVLRDAHGNQYPTDGCSVQMLHYAIQRSPKAWARPAEFLPERFLVEPGHELYPAKGAWRPFEYGPRLCTGQQLVMKELKAFLVLLAREFDIKECYGEIDGDSKRDLTHVDFEKAHLVEAGAAHPRANFPCRVSFSGYQTSTSI